METKYTIPNYILASKNTRALNFIIDIIFIHSIKAILYFLAAFITFNDEYYSLLDWLISFDRTQNFLFWSLIMFIYYATFEILLSRTLSKYFTKTIVVKIDGSKPNIIEFLGRSLIRIIPFEYLSFLRGRQPGWHDEYSKTYVVIKSKLEKTKKEYMEFINI